MNVPRNSVFDFHFEQYEEWFIRHKSAYLSEVIAVRTLLPEHGLGLEIGVGTGRFAAPLGMDIGVDPSRAMLTYAVRNGIASVQGVAENLPFKTAIFDHCLVVTTICFVDDARKMLREASRVLKTGGSIIIGFVDRTSSLGTHYLANKSESTFYQGATFYSTAEVCDLLMNTGFFHLNVVQTLTKSLENINEIEPVRTGSGIGAFVVVRAEK